MLTTFVLYIVNFLEIGSTIPKNFADFYFKILQKTSNTEQYHLYWNDIRAALKFAVKLDADITIAEIKDDQFAMPVSYHINRKHGPVKLAEDESLKKWNVLKKMMGITPEEKVSPV